MNEHDLFRAIGGTNDVFLQEIDQPPVRRIPKHMGLIAALLALVLTACAAPVVIRSFDKVQSGSRSQDGNGYTIHVYKGGSKTSERVYFTSSDVELEVERNANAPGTIEEYSMPLKLLDYCDVESYTDTGTLFAVSFSMSSTEQEKGCGILYRQYVIPADGTVVAENFLGSEEWEREEKNYGDMKVLEFHGYGALRNTSGNIVLNSKTKVMQTYIRHIFWSDGMYLYCLKLPQIYPITYADVEQIVTSLTPVEDITEYLPAVE